MEQNTFSDSELERAAELKQAQLYREGGFKKAKPLVRNLADYENHLFAFLIDLNICLLPVYIWAVLFLMIVAGLLPGAIFDLLFYLMYGLLFVMTCLVLPLYTAGHHGQSYGDRILGLRLVRRNRRPASAIALVMRQLLGFGVPTMVLGYFFSVFGVLGWWLLNGIIVLISPNQQTLFDWLLGLILVYTPTYKIRLEKPEAQKPVQSEPQPEKPAEQPKQPEPASLTISPIDLHIRSDFSDDGQYDVESLFQMAQSKGMKVISITDHNNARANSQCERFAQMYDIQYIPGVEIDTQCNGQRVRLLGYYIDWNKPVFQEIELLSLAREKEASIVRAQALEKVLGIRIDVEGLMQGSRYQIISSRDLTNMVFNNPECRKIPMVAAMLQDAPNERQARLDFRQAMFGQDGPCSVRVVYPEAQSVMKAIHDSGGLVVLSNWRLGSLKPQTWKELLGENALHQSIDGIEVFSPAADTKLQAKLLMLCKEKGLYTTAGSDFHGNHKPSRQLGVTTCPAKGLEMVEIFARAIDAGRPQTSARS